MVDVPDELAGFLDEEVVLDTRGPIIYLGILGEVTDHFFVLEDADVHDMLEAPTTKEVYLIEARKFGIKKNRESVHVRRDEIVSLSRLEDVIPY